MADPAASPAPPKAVPPSTPSAPVSSSNQARPSFAVGLNEAALDSPTFRATSSHFAEQVDGIERWLEGYVKSQSKLVHDLLALEETINTFLSRSTPSAAAADGVIDNDYTLLALKRVGDGSREWWTHILSTVRRMDSISLDPIRHLLNGELRTFKEARKALEQTQKHFDTTLARYVGQSKTKEASALREDAFAVYEARKAYLKASMDFCQMAPQLRYSLDKLLVRVSADFWREMKRSRESASSYAKWGDEMERVRGWARDLESTEGSLRRELQISRREVGETTLATFKPSRELDDYSVSTVPFLGSRGPMNMRTKDQDSVISEKQGWLFLRTVSGKPARFTWVRRWYYCRDGIFGWLVQSGHGVLQGDEIGVLLCGAKPAVQEERRFCFEIKTKSQTLLLQAETQSQLTEWLEVFEVAKKQAFEASMGRDAPSAAGVDPAFAITPPLVPEFSAKALDSQLGVGGEDAATGADRGATLPVPGNDASHMSRSSFDAPLNPPRRSITTALVREEGESSRDHAARIMQKLDLHRKGDAAPQQAAGGIASLISASHNLLPGYMMQNPSATQLPRAATFSHIPAAPQLPLGEVRRSNLAPVTLAKPPAPTGLSKAAVLTSGELGLGGADPTHTLPTAIMANYWGSNLWGAAYTPRQESAPTPAPNDDDPFLRSAMPLGSPTNGQASRSPNSLHRKTFSADVKIMPPRILEKAATESFPANYPAELRAQLAQFRLLFPSVPLEEKLVLVFRAAWSSATESGSSASGLVGSGRVYITPDNMYFYGQQMGLITAYSFSLDIISEVTAAPGKDCDYIYLHLNQDTNETGFKRITLKTFLDDLALLHARLNLLVDDLQAEEPMELPDLIDALINLANDDREIKSPGAESWGEGSGNESPDEQTPVPGRAIGRRDYSDAKSGRVARKLVPKFQLPSHPVVYEPEDMGQPDAERHFEISAKACFHVLFGDKSFIFPKLYFERRAKEIAQGPWDLADQGKMKRTFRFKVDFADLLGRKRLSDIVDQQNIDVFSDHVTYVVTHHGTPWHLPHSQDFKIICKIVITHIAKSKCKLAIYNRIEWTKPPAFSKNIIERQALNDARRNAEELAEVATDQVRKLGPHSRTKRAIQVYGNLGQQTQVVVFTPGEADPVKKTQVKQRTLTDMLSETVFSFAESVASSLMMWTFAGVKKLYDVVTAQRIILLVLALSVFTNLVFSSRETSTWWTERRAAKFMSRIGVGPNVAMSKSIYIADLEEAAQQSGLPPHRTPTDSPCYDTFCNIVNTTDIDAPYEDAGDMLSAASSRAAAKRLRRTRQKLGSYRHDLLVAMRVVNSIEREMVQSEWENWLADEMLRCDQVKALLHSQQPAGGGSAKKSKKAAAAGEASKGSNGPQKVMRPLDEARIGSLKKWHEEYCGSCRADQRDLEGYRLAHRTMMG